MHCDDVLKQLDRYRTDETPAGIAASIVAHLRECPECSSALSELRHLAAAFSQLGSATPGDMADEIVENTIDRFGVIETDLGKVWIGFNSRGITLVHARLRRPGDFATVYLGRRFRVAQPAAVPRQYADPVRSAISGERTSLPKLDLEGLTPFEKKTLLLLPAIPHGEVRTYSWLARETGNPKAVRAIGTIMARNPLPFLLPCHRVVPAQGGIGNYAFGSAMKRTLLKREGVPLGELAAMERDGYRLLGCKSTLIYCFPTCHDAQRMKPSNRLEFVNASEAVQAGYRPCRHCRP